MSAQIGDLGLPGGELGVEVLQIAELPAWHEVALDVLHAGLDLALGLGPMRSSGADRCMTGYGSHGC